MECLLALALVVAGIPAAANIPGVAQRFCRMLASVPAFPDFPAVAGISVVAGVLLRLASLLLLASLPLLVSLLELVSLLWSLY